jgi:hypothetical protein
MTLDAAERGLRALLNDEQGVDLSRVRVPCLSRRAGIGDASPAAQAWLLRGAAKAALQLTGSRAPVPVLRCSTGRVMGFTRGLDTRPRFRGQIRTTARRFLLSSESTSRRAWLHLLAPAMSPCAGGFGLQQQAGRQGCGDRSQAIWPVSRPDRCGLLTYLRFV